MTVAIGHACGSMDIPVSDFSTESADTGLVRGNGSESDFGRVDGTSPLCLWLKEKNFTLAIPATI